MNAKGRLVQVNTSGGGVPKRPVSEARVFFDRVEGDDWNDKLRHGTTGQAVLLYSAEMIDEMVREGFPLFPGALGENFTTTGIDFRTVRPGQMFRVGAEVEIRITKVRKPCHTIAVYGTGIEQAAYDAAVKAGDATSPKWGKSGFYAEVLKEGIVRPGDPIAEIETR